MNREKRLLRDIAREVSRGLRSRRIGQPLKLRQKPSITETDTDGFCATLGLIQGKSCDLEIWLDRYPGLDRSIFYYGFDSEKEGPIRSLARAASRELGPHGKLCDRDYKLHEGRYRLRAPMRRDRFGRPFLECYPNKKAFFYGIYDDAEVPPEGKDRDRLVERIVGFFESVLTSLPEFSAPELNHDVYPKIENRKVVASHLRRERSGYLATRRKQADGYTCQICGFHFEDVYGELGRDFAEAHHTVPLAKHDEVRHTTIGDLITVCSNCHRMLHRMNGTRKDPLILKQRVRKSLRPARCKGHTSSSKRKLRR